MSEPCDRSRNPKAPWQQQAPLSGSRRNYPLVLLVLGMLSLVSERAQAQPKVPSYQRGACTFEEAASLGPTVECGTLTVAEDGARPGGRAVRVSVAVLKARGPSPAPDPLVYLSGGPGSGGIGEAASWLERPFVRQRDVVLVDQRGTGSSEPLCPETAKTIVQLMARDLTPAEDLAENVRAAHGCLEQLRNRGVDPTAYASAATAADLDALRRALGYPSWNLLGISYGTRLALTAMRDRPEGIRSVVLDSPFPPAEDFYLNLGLGFDLGLDRLAADCAAAPSCHDAVGDLKAELAALEAELAAHPVRLRLDDAELAPGGTVVVNAADLRFLVGELMASGASRAVLPAMIHAWRQGKTDSLAPLFRFLALTLQSHDVGKYYAVQCTEEMPFSALRLGAARGAGTPGVPGAGASGSPLGAIVLPTAFHDAAPAVCADWNLPPADPRENEAVSSPIPTLLLAGELDPRAPPAFAERALPHLTHGALVQVPGAAHHTLDDGCVSELVAAFLADPAQPPDASCLGHRRVASPLGAVHATGGPLRLLAAVRRGPVMSLLWPMGSLVVLLAAVVIWPVRSLWHWRRSGRRPADDHARVPVHVRRLSALAHGALALAAVVACVFVAALARATSQLLAGDYALAIVLGLPGEGRALFLLPKVALGATLVGLGAAAVGWRRLAWSRSTRAQWLLTLAAAASFLVFLARYDLF